MTAFQEPERNDQVKIDFIDQLFNSNFEDPFEQAVTAFKEIVKELELTLLSATELKASKDKIEDTLNYYILDIELDKHDLGFNFEDHNYRFNIILIATNETGDTLSILANIEHKDRSSSALLAGGDELTDLGENQAFMVFNVFNSSALDQYYEEGFFLDSKIELSCLVSKETFKQLVENFENNNDVGLVSANLKYRINRELSSTESSDFETCPWTRVRKLEYFSEFENYYLVETDQKDFFASVQFEGPMDLIMHVDPSLNNIDDINFDNYPEDIVLERTSKYELKGSSLWRRFTTHMKYACYQFLLEQELKEQLTNGIKARDLRIEIEDLEFRQTEKIINGVPIPKTKKTLIQALVKLKQKDGSFLYVQLGSGELTSCTKPITYCVNLEYTKGSKTKTEMNLAPIFNRQELQSELTSLIFRPNSADGVLKELIMSDSSFNEEAKIQVFPYYKGGFKNENLQVFLITTTQAEQCQTHILKINMFNSTWFITSLDQILAMMKSRSMTN